MEESFKDHDPSARWTFFDPAPPCFAAKTKLALKRSNSRLCGRSAQGGRGPGKISNARSRKPVGRALETPSCVLKKDPCAEEEVFNAFTTKTACLFPISGIIEPSFYCQGVFKTGVGFAKKPASRH
jgi:hypothetical protein